MGEALLCKDCCNYLPGSPFGEAKCYRPTTTRKSVVTGGYVDRLKKSPYREREEAKSNWFGATVEKCGPEAKFFEPHRPPNRCSAVSASTTSAAYIQGVTAERNRILALLSEQSSGKPNDVLEQMKNSIMGDAHGTSST